MSSSVRPYLVRCSVSIWILVLLCLNPMPQVLILADEKTKPSEAKVIRLKEVEVQKLGESIVVDLGAIRIGREQSFKFRLKNSTEEILNIQYFHSGCSLLRLKSSTAILSADPGADFSEVEVHVTPGHDPKKIQVPVSFSSRNVLEPSVQLVFVATVDYSFEVSPRLLVLNGPKDGFVDSQKVEFTIKRVAEYDLEGEPVIVFSSYLPCKQSIAKRNDGSFLATVEFKTFESDKLLGVGNSRNFIVNYKRDGREYSESIPIVLEFRNHFRALPANIPLTSKSEESVVGHFLLYGETDEKLTDKNVKATFKDGDGNPFEGSIEVKAISDHAYRIGLEIPSDKASMTRGLPPTCTLMRGEDQICVVSVFRRAD